jgi:hypothetical protein
MKLGRTSFGNLSVISKIKQDKIGERIWEKGRMTLASDSDIGGHA